MKPLALAVFLLATVAALSSCANGNRSPEIAPDRTADTYQLRQPEDLNSDPDILEINLVAEIRPVALNTEGPVANMYTFNGGTPGPELRLEVGDTLVVHFTNLLPEPTAIHWHGIELDNANDGTTVTQDPVKTGETFDYRFKLVRPGVFWYHPHAMPTNPEFKGLYGPLIVDDPAEQKLIEAGVLPPPDATRTFMLADTTVCKAPGQNDPVTFEPGAQVPWVFSESIGPFPGLVAYPSPVDLCENPRDIHGELLRTGPLAVGEIPNIQPPTHCGAKFPCRVNEGQLVLTNGQVASPRGGTPASPGVLRGDQTAMEVTAGGGVRLRLLNAAVSRYFRLLLTTPDGTKIPLYRIGGQGGLLDAVRLEGGTLGTLNTKYSDGELVLGVAERADVMFRVPEGITGEVLTLWTQDYQHYGTAVYPFGYGGLPTVPVAHFRVKESQPGRRNFQVAAGDPLRTHATVATPVADIKAESTLAELIDPGQLSPAQPGTPDPEILFTIVGLRETIDGIQGIGLEGGGQPFREIPHIPSSRYARLGDLLELRVRNGTQMHHPIHLHGFSFQPVRMEDPDGNVVYEYDYNEFVDTVDVPATTTLVYRVHLEDRPMMDGSPGGGLGRWLYHCHIFNHSGLGMITELVVLPAE